VLLRRPTAIKQLLPERVGADNLARFEREVHHTSQLTHPNTVAVYDFGRGSDGTFYYAMEYLGGGIDLEQLVRVYGPQPAARVVPILVQVCGALQEAHDMGIIHRDIKPANIMLCERGGLPDVAKVVDFGLVKEITAETGDSQQMILGTPAYLAPEAVNDPHTVGPALDLYALGCVGYYLLTGRMVFEGKTAIAICIQHAADAPTPPSKLVAMPSELEAILLRCLAKLPSERFASADELAEALSAVPVSGWREADAHDWWKDVHPSIELAPTTSPTAAITIDLGRRIDEVQR
jgi:serine/threonine protein kinase